MKGSATIALTPLSGLYGLLINRRNGLYRRGVFQSHHVDVPVISVGNLTLGGTGKTPLVLRIAQALAEQGLRVCILTRGYRRNSKGRVVVSDGTSVIAAANEAGDEALMLAEATNGKVAVVCDANRLAGARWATQNLKSDVIVLDDGFQHRRLARDLDIVVIDATNPWGNGHLLPAGTLREPLSGLCRANCFVITRANDQGQVAALREELETINAAAPIFTAVTRISKITRLTDEQTVDIESVTDAVTAFCAIGNPNSFFSLLTTAGIRMANQRAFRDHHYFAQSDIDSIETAARAAGVGILMTTAKDAVKLRTLSFGLPCYVVDITIDIQPEADFRQLIAQAVSNFKTA